MRRRRRSRGEAEIPLDRRARRQPTMRRRGERDSGPDLGRGERSELSQSVRDEVNEPLGQAPRAPCRPAARDRRRSPRLGLALAVVRRRRCCAIVEVRQARRRAFRRRAHRAARPARRRRPPPPPDDRAAPTPASAATNGDQIEAASGVKVVRSGGGGAAGALIIDVPQALGVRLAAAPDKRLVEKSRYGLLPRIGADGARPADVYARPVVASARLQARRAARRAPGRRPRPQRRGHRRRDRAGCRRPSRSASRPTAATSSAKPPRRARRATKSCCRRRWSLSPTPPTIPARTRCSTAASDAENLDSLRWLMARFAGYVGVVNHLGGKFTADARALSPALGEIAARGLVYLDDGSSPRSLAARGRADARSGLGRAPTWSSTPTPRRRRSRPR